MQLPSIEQTPVAPEIVSQAPFLLSRQDFYQKHDSTFVATREFQWRDMKYSGEAAKNKMLYEGRRLQFNYAINLVVSILSSAAMTKSKDFHSVLVGSILRFFGYCCEGL